MKLIALSPVGKYAGKYFAEVDDEDYEWLNQWRWSVKFGKTNTYAGRQVYSNGVRSYIQMHRLVMGIKNPNILIDHKDGNGINNTRNNLRIATKSQNHQNSRKTKNSSSKYKGVFVCTRRSTYKLKTGEFKNYEYRLITASIRFDKRLIALGCFKTEEDAAGAYDAAAKKYFGEFANLNFPNV